MQAIDKTTEICIWGAGLVGYSLACALVGTGRRCLLVDVSSEVVGRINAELPPTAFHTAYGSPHPEAGVSGRLRATMEPSQALTAEHPVHILGVPTERGGLVCPNALRQVVERVARAESVPRPLYFLIESTVSPDWIDGIVHPTFRAAGWRHGEDYHVGCSPRRDVFGDPAYTMQHLDKVYGADSEAGAELMQSLYNPLCRGLHRAPDARHAALTKLVENLYRHQAILMANRLTAALPGFDVAEVLRLAATKWNMELYHPSLGIGGYCVPLARDYLASTADPQWRENLVPVDDEPRLGELFLDALFPEASGRRVGLLGLSYAPGLRIVVNAPALRVVRHLQRRGIVVAMHDPYFDESEIRSLAGVPRFDFPSELRDYDDIVLMTAHAEYCQISDRELAAHLPGRARLIDNCGTWRRRRLAEGIRYIEVGGAGFRGPGIPDGHVGCAREADAADCSVASSPSMNRVYLERLERAGELPAFHTHVDRILQIDRDYLHVQFDGERLNIPQLGERVRALRGKPVAGLMDVQIDTICALGVYGMAWVRLEYVDMQVTMERACRYLMDTAETYNRNLVECGEEPARWPRGSPWWEIAPRLPELRERIDRNYHRLSLINGANWYRREVFLRKQELEPQPMPRALADALDAHSPVPGLIDPRAPHESLRALTSALLERDLPPTPLLVTLMKAATEDPRIGGHHTTLLCPRGTTLERPWEMSPEDFLAYVVFRPGFEPPVGQGMHDTRTIQKAMLAHHAAKKTKLARRYKARYGPGSVAQLADNLGDLGIYYNEDAHHKGHQVAGIATAMRYLMPVQVRRGDEEFRIEGLTDFRVTRTSRAERDRYRLEEFPPFHDYGGWARTILETSYSNGFVFPRMLENWR